MSTSFYIYETRYQNTRKCEVCASGMTEGYLHEESGRTYCTVICLFEDYECGEIDGTSDDEVFWTTWYDEVEGLG